MMRSASWFKIWQRERRLGRSGCAAETYFLEAVNRLGYVCVSQTNRRLAYTVRRGDHQEEHHHIDFLFTDKIDDVVIAIPVDLTIACNLSQPKLRAKLERANAGEVALVWPGQGLTSKEFLHILRCAAHDDQDALADVRRALKLAFERYLDARAASGKQVF